jgi:hypothetical protein
VLFRFMLQSRRCTHLLPVCKRKNLLAWHCCGAAQANFTGVSFIAYAFVQFNTNGVVKDAFGSLRLVPSASKRKQKESQSAWPCSMHHG